MASFARFRADAARAPAARVFWGWLAWQLAGCGVDAERRYAGLSSLDVQVAEGGYRVRYLSPPWYSVPDDPLVTGAREQVPIGETDQDIVPHSARVLEIERAGSVEDPTGLSYPKYRLEAALLRCTQAQLDAAPRCAEALAAQDLAGRSASEETDAFGGALVPGTNDFGQAYWELMTRVPELSRYRRIRYLQAAQEGSAARVFVEANPALDEREVTRMLDAFELLPGGAAEDPR